jgi:hypothetical protein
MVDPEMIAATLAAGILNGRGIPNNEEGAKITVEFYRQIVTALAKAGNSSHEPLDRISDDILAFASGGGRRS